MGWFGKVFSVLRLPGFLTRRGVRTPPSIPTTVTTGGHRVFPATPASPQPHPTARPTKDVGPDDAVSFELGEWVPVSSSWVRWVRYVPRQGGRLGYLEVRFKDGGGARYTPISPQEAGELMRSASKGKWLWDHCLKRGRGNKGKHQKHYNRM